MNRIEEEKGKDRRKGRQKKKKKSEKKERKTDGKTRKEDKYKLDFTEQKTSLCHTLHASHSPVIAP